MPIRPATSADLAEIQAIYAHHVLHGTGTFEDAPPSVEEVTARFAAATEAGGRAGWLVATDATGVQGYVIYAQYRDRSGYRFCAEDGVYVRDDVRGQGLGKTLVAAAIEAAAAAGYTQMIAVIGDQANAGSIGLHASLGFRQVGLLRGVGFKFGRWLDVVLMQRALADGTER